MAGRIATITGTMLTPGVSRNGRLYAITAPQWSTMPRMTGRTPMS
jgi:hypothetical protein